MTFINRWIYGKPKALAAFVPVALCVALGWFSISSTSDAERAFSPKSLSSDQENLPAFLEYQTLVEEALVWRVKVVEFLEKLKRKEVYSGRDLQLIHVEGTASYVRIREELLESTEAYRWVTGKNVQIEFTQDATKIKKKREGVWPFRRTQINVQLNPSDAQGRVLVREMKTSLASALILYDNYILAISQIQAMSKLRNIVNVDNDKREDYLKEVTRNYNREENFERSARAIHWVEGMMQHERAQGLELDDPNQYLNDLILSSYTYHHLRNTSGLDLLHGDLVYTQRALSDRVLQVKEETVHEISKLFGNSAGLVQWRKGKLHSLTSRERRMVSGKMKPLDLLLEKTPFRLTDKMIPGHWGHVAVWTGTKEDLIELEVWDQLPTIYKHAKDYRDYRGSSFQDAVESGQYIIEALRPGVQINTLEHFLNIDDLGVIRPKDLTREQRQKYLLLAFQQIGKDYDFNFDVESDREIVCSELAYVVYGDDHWQWPTDNAMNRYTISPDHVGMRAMKSWIDGQLTEASFDPVLLYHDGQRCKKDVKQTFQQLMEQEYERVSCRG